MIKHTLIVLKKELVDAVRDRRSIVSSSMYAVWAPLAVALATSALARDRSSDQLLSVAVAGRDHAASLVSYLEQQDMTVTALDDDPRVAVREGRFDVAVLVPDGYRSRFEASEPAPIELVYDGAQTRSLARAERLRRILDGYGRQVAETRLLVRGVVPDISTPVEIRDHDVSTSEGRAGRLLVMLPVFLLVAAFAGGMGIAIDLTAGERERGSLEALLLHPVSPAAIIVGKWMAASAITAFTVVVMIVITRAVLLLPKVRAIDLPIGLSSTDAVMTAVVLLPLVLLAPALQMLVSMFAATYKEAQTQASMLLLLPMIPGFLIAFGSLRDVGLLPRIPLVAQQLLVTDVLAGRPVDAGRLAFAAAITTAFAAVALSVAARLLVRERVGRGRVG